ncbi:MAG TPA: hypothetical protein DCZ95_01030 [Verrucomicrobia bacterium]|nr:MAG: hypothetical protein A2X46_12070 [Lentisphaerae bacterium GWF2_57_35]HBA82651.1 hypothetical protein [Verrucomicrobiota bacterium]
MTDPNTSIRDFLVKNGPCLSSDLKAALVKKGVSEVNIRQRLSRAGGDIHRLVGLNLPKRTAFFYLERQYKSADYWRNLLHAMTQTNSAHGTAIHGLLARDGIIKKSEFDIVSGAPQRLTKHIPSSAILDQLCTTGFLKIESHDVLGKCVLIDSRCNLANPTYTSLRNRLIVEDVLLAALSEWVRKTGLGSFNKVHRKTDSTPVPQFGSFAWDMTAPSYVHPLVSVHKDQPPTSGFVVADVIVDREVSQDDVRYFIRKCSTMRALRNTRPFMAIMLADRFERDAFVQGKSAGVLFTTPDVLFGQQIAESLKALISTLNNAAKYATVDPDKVMYLLSNLSSIEGAAINLRGALFELVVGHLVSKLEGGGIDIGMHVKSPEGKSAEIDVRLAKGDHEVRSYECKAKAARTQVSLDEVQRWADVKVPVIRDALLSEKRFQNCRMFFEFWTTGTFCSEAVSFLELKRTSIKKYVIQWKDGSEVLSSAREAKSSPMVAILNQHYLEHVLK